MASLLTAAGGIASGSMPPAPDEDAPRLGVSCPPSATPEGEPCDGTYGQGTVNGGCNIEPVFFGAAACGETICGEAWAFGQVRDTDNFEMPTPQAARVSLTLTAEFPASVFGVNTGSGVDCGISYVVEGLLIPADTTGTLTLSQTTSDGDIVYWFIGASIFDGVPCDSEGEFGNGWVASFACVTACEAAGDTNGDGFIDFDDLLEVVANFGRCP